MSDEPNYWRLNPRVQLHRLDFQQLLVVKEEVPPEQQDWISCLDQEDPEPPNIKEEQEDPEPPHIKEEREDPEPPHIKEEREDPEPPHIKEEREDPEPPHIKEERKDPEPPHIKEEQEDPEPPHIKDEQEELWTSQEGEQLQGLEEAGIKFSFTPVKSEEDEEEAQSSQLHRRQTEQMETEADGADCGGSEPDRELDPERHPGPDTDEFEDWSEPQTDDSIDWKETQEPQLDLNPLQNNEVPVSDVNCSTGNTSVNSPECAGSSDHKVHMKRHTRSKTGVKLFSCSVCSQTFSHKRHMDTHMTIHTGVKPFSCSMCSQTFLQKWHLKSHMTIHTGMKPFSCSVCRKTFSHKGGLKRHMTIHTGVKPFSCSVCSKTFSRKRNLYDHMTIHTGVKPFSCSMCSKTFSHKRLLNTHMTNHTGVKPFSCSMCSQTFLNKWHLKSHMNIHTGMKPFSCSVCSKTFSHKGTLNVHMRIHTGVKPFSCSVCSKTFSQKGTLKRHLKVHTRETNYVQVHELRVPVKRPCARAQSPGEASRCTSSGHTGVTMIRLLLMCFVLCVVSGSSKPTEKKSRVHEEEPLSHLEHDDDKNHDYDHEAFLGEDQAKAFDQLTPEESQRRLGIIVDKMDSNTDGFVSEEELKDWIKKAQTKHIYDNVEHQWKDFDLNHDDVISWEEYKNVTYGSYLEEPQADSAFNYSHMMAREERRFRVADRNGDLSADKQEFAAFLHPEEHEYMKDSVVQETMEDIDTNGDGFIDLKEYIGDMHTSEEGEEEPEWMESERQQFSELRDKNKDGKMDREETLDWILPSDNEHTEAKHLLEEADANQDQRLTKSEILNKYDLFVGSQITDFGYALHDEF